MNPREPRDFPLGRWNLYIGGAGRAVIQAFHLPHEFFDEQPAKDKA